MNIKPAVTPSGIGCRIASDCFNAALTIDGMRAAELAYLFGFAKAPAFEWTDLQARGAIHVALDGHSSPERDGQLELDLEDGRVTTATDQPAQLRVVSHHSLRQTLFPKSLNLCLAQQWARAGILPVHGAGIVVNQVGTLVLGGKAVGKSTLAAVALTAGAQVVSDDWMLLGINAQGKPAMERLRQFLMLRHSSSTDSILAQASKLSYQASTSRPKFTLSVQAEDPGFPRCHNIAQIWLMRRNNPRPEYSSVDPAETNLSLSTLISHSMPILFGPSFPTEHSHLKTMLGDALGRSKLCRVSTGLDLMQSPSAILECLSNSQA